MNSRSWDDPWQRYPASKPIRVEHGIASRKKRGDMASTWWSKRFVGVLESFGLGARMQRGRRYARAGQVLSLEVDAGLIAAQVQGSRPTPYLVTVRSAPASETQWLKLEDAFRSRVGFVAQLLAGEVPPELEEAFSSARIDLFPRRWADIDARCNCPDRENPCKHLAAVLYVFADQLDDNPWLLLTWRGRRRDDLLETLRLGAGSSLDLGAEVAPWWPLVPGHLDSPATAPAITAGVDAANVVPPEPRDRVLRRLGALEVKAFGGAALDALVDVYPAVNAVDDPGSV